MALNSINTNIGAYYAQRNIGIASNSASLSIARLSSGSRIVRAADDVAAMSAGTSLQTNVTTLRMALINTSQGSSLLQVADGALSQITDILQRQKAIAVQAGSGSLSAAERGFLNQEFQNLTQEIDRLATQTNFNGVNLLDGLLSTTVSAELDSSAATGGEASISFNANATDTANLTHITVNGVDVILDLTPAAGQVQIGLSTGQTVQNLANFLNGINTQTTFTQAQRLAISAATYEADGNTLIARARAGGTSDVFNIGNIVPAAANNWMGQANGAVLTGDDSGTYSYLFQGALGVASADISAVSANNATAAIPFKNTAVLTIKQGGGVATAIHSFASGQSLNDIVNSINSNTATHGYTVKLVGSSGNYNMLISHTNPDLDNTGTATDGGDLTITAFAANTAANNTGALLVGTTAANNVNVGRTGLVGSSTGIGVGDVVGIGIIGDSIIADHSQTKSKVSIIFPDITPAALNTTLAPTATTAFGIQIGDPAVANERIEFTFSANSAGRSSTEILIGSTLEETIDNAVATINSFSTQAGVLDFDMRQLEARREGTTLIIESKNYGSTVHLDASTVVPAAISAALVNTPAGVSITNGGALSNGTTAGVYSSAVSNKDFIGTLQGFSATYNGTANTVNAEITVGGETFRALNVTTNINSSTNSANIVRFFGDNGGGYFDLTMRVNGGMTVNSQSEADTYATRLDAAFSTLEFYQNRDVSSYAGVDPIVTDGVVTGSLLDTKLSMNDKDFTDVKINDINITAPSGSAVDGTITFTINGEEFSAPSDIGTRLSAYQTYKFTSATDANRYLEFTVGGTNIDFDTQAKADAFEQALKDALGVGQGAEALQFQVGTTVSDTLQVSIDGVTSSQINIADLDVLTQANASAAADALDTAIDMVTSVRADVGALQSRFSFAAANVESSIQNQDAARGVLLDTDVAAESTSFATAQVKLQAGIAVLAQANLLQQNLLKLIG